MEYRKSSGRVGGMIEGPKEGRHSTKRPTESTNLDTWGFPETESPKIIHGLDLGLAPHPT